jgi:ribonuclease D
MKLHRHREHNYVKKLSRLIAQGALPLGTQGEFLAEPFLERLAAWATEHPEWHAAEMRKWRRP